MYQGNSIVDYLTQTGQKSDFASRAQLAASKGIQGYTGSAQQNTQLLNTLRGSGGVSANIPPSQTNKDTPQVQTPQPQMQPVQQQPVQQPQQTSGQPQSAQDLVNMGYQGYQGWGNTEAVADFKATGGQGKGGQTQGGTSTSGGATTGFLNTPIIDLPNLYEGLYASSGIKEIENELSTKSMAYNEAVAKIKDNPYLSEATMTGRLSKLEDKFNADTQSLQTTIASRKADVETQLNIQMKQFDINSTQAQQAIQQFNTLLSSGALNNASGEDIANIVRATGISSAMIQNAINAKAESEKDTQLISYDDGEEQGFVTVDSQTGEILNKQVMAASTKGQTTGTSGEREADRVKNQLAQNVKNGMTLGDAINLYGDSLNLNDIVEVYNQNSIYGKAQESGATIKEMYTKSQQKLGTIKTPDEGSISGDGTQIYLNGKWQEL